MAAVSPARMVAFRVVVRVFEEGAWADRALIGEARRAGLDGRDRALAMQLAYGTVQRKATLDHLIATLAGRPPEELDAEVRTALRLGLYQLAFLERVPDHAAVGEAVELAKAERPRGTGLVNAVLRRGAREARAIVAALPDATPEQAALKHSHPEWVARLWWTQLGAEDARALMAAGNRPPEPALRVNTLKTTRAELAAALPVGSHTSEELPEALVLEAPYDVHGSELFAAGHFVAQSRAAQSVAHTVGPQAGERVLDLCAAPGGKATHLAALGARVVAVEKDGTRARQLVATAERLGADLEVRTMDARTFDELEAYDRVLVDPPCTDLGTLALRPDARWRKQPADAERLAVLQREILDAGARALKPGGVLVYSTCTISPVENERQVASFGADHPVWDDPDVVQTFPHRDGTDGFFVARWVKQ